VTGVESSHKSSWAAKRILPRITLRAFGFLGVDFIRRQVLGLFSKFSNFLNVSCKFKIQASFYSAVRTGVCVLLGTTSLGAGFFSENMCVSILNVKIPGSTRVLSALCGFDSVVRLEIMNFYSAVKWPTFSPFSDVSKVFRFLNKCSKNCRLIWKFIIRQYHPVWKFFCFSFNKPLISCLKLG